MATPTTQGSASVEECEDYIEKHGIQGLLKECIAKICQERPANPYKWLSEYFDTLDHKIKKVGLDPLYAAVYVWAACGRRGRSFACVCVYMRVSTPLLCPLIGMGTYKLQMCDDITCGRYRFSTTCTCVYMHMNSACIVACCLLTCIYL